MKTSIKKPVRLAIVVLLNAGLTACLPNNGFRDDDIINYPSGNYTGLPGEEYHPASSSDSMDETTPPQGGINVGNGAGNAEQVDDIQPLEFHVQGIGNEDVVSFPVQANQILKVKFAALPQDRTVAGTGFSPNYGGLGVYIKVGALQQPTPLLSSGVIAPQQFSKTMNFSAQIPSTCGDNTACRTTVFVKVTKANYDFYCLNYPGGWLNGDQWYYPCNYPGYTKVHKNHPWNGTLYVYTDDTGAPSN